MATEQFRQDDPAVETERLLRQVPHWLSEMQPAQLLMGHDMQEFDDESRVKLAWH